MSRSAFEEECTAACGSTRPDRALAASHSHHEPALASVAMSLVHDIRNPLAAIHSGAELLNGSRPADEDVQRLARNMYQASVRIQEMLHDYAEFFRTRRADSHASNLRLLVTNAVHRVEATAKAQSVEMVQDVPEHLTVKVNRRQVGSVLSNLLLNAIEAMPAGGRIDISAAVEGRTAVVKVLDSGPGVPAEIRDRLFDPLVTACKPNGWGMGLAHARQAVLDHGGQIWLETAPGGGACFVFTLPVNNT